MIFFFFLASSSEPQPSCPENMFVCNNNACVPQNQVCDFSDDCGDWSDENNCGEMTLNFKYVILNSLVQHIHTYESLHTAQMLTVYFPLS